MTGDISTQINTQQLATDILNMLRERNLSYGDASSTLRYAQTLLQRMSEYELCQLPLAGGLTHPFNPDLLQLFPK